MIIRNVAMRWLAWAVTLVITLLITPYIIGTLGLVQYGIWLTIMSVSLFAAILDLGFSAAFYNRFKRQYSTGDLSGLKTTVNTIFHYYLLLGLFSLLAIAVVAFTNPYGFIAEGGAERQVTVALLIIAVSTAVEFPGRAYEIILLSIEEQHLLAKIQMVISVIRVLLIIVAFHAGLRLVGLALAHSLATVLNNLVMFFLAIKKVPEARPRGFTLAKDVYVAMWGFAKDALLGMVGTKVRDQTPKMILGAHSPVDVAYFGLGMRLIRYWLELATLYESALHPRYVELFAQHKMAELKNTFIRSLKYSGVIAGFVSLVLWTLSGPFIDLWLKEDFSATIRMLRFLALPIYVMVTVTSCETVLLAMGLHRRNAIVRFAEALIMVSVGLAFMDRLGFFGFAIGFALGSGVVRPLLLAPLVCREVGIPWHVFWLKTVTRASGGAVACFTVYWFFGRGLAIHSWPALFVAGAALAAVYALAVWVVVLDRDDRSFWLATLKRTLAGKA